MKVGPGAVMWNKFGYRLCELTLYVTAYKLLITYGANTNGPGSDCSCIRHIIKFIATSPNLMDLF